MLHRIELSYLNNRNIIRIVRYSLISIVLLIITWVFDYRYPHLKINFPEIVLLEADVTSSFLSNLSGTFLTVSTFTFTTILTVLNKYSGSFSPSLVQDFIDQPNVLSLFGVFIGGFFYTVLALFLIQNIDSDVPLISGTIAVFYAITAMISFVLFVRRVLTDIKGSNVIENVYQNALDLIEEEAQKRKDSERFDSEDYVEEFKVYANESGYLYDIDSKGLLGDLKDFKTELVIDKRIGDYVSKGMYIATLHALEDIALEGEEKEELFSKLSNHLVVNVNKNEFKDYHYEITNLVEMALIALSSGTQDPNTAITIIRKISLLLGKLFSTDNFYVVLDEDEQTKIVYYGYTVKEELYNSYAQIIHYGKEDPLVSKAILDGLYMVYLIADKSVQPKVVNYMDYAYEVCRDAMTTRMDREELRMVYEDFNRNRDEQSDEDVIREKG